MPSAAFQLSRIFDVHTKRFLAAFLEVLNTISRWLNERPIIWGASPLRYWASSRRRAVKKLCPGPIEGSDHAHFAFLSLLRWYFRWEAMRCSGVRPNAKLTLSDGLNAANPLVFVDVKIRSFYAARQIANRECLILVGLKLSEG